VGSYPTVSQIVGDIVINRHRLKIGEDHMNVYQPSKQIVKTASTLDKPTTDEVEDAYRTILRYAGENPDRDGLHETPARAARALNEHFGGYRLDPAAILDKTFEETDGYDEMVVLRGIPFESHCEHHLAPIIGKAWIAYLPRNRVVGISKLARVVDAFAKRLQIQERMTSQIANVVAQALEPLGVGVVVKAAHLCMLTRGVHKHSTDMVTSRMLGAFRSDPMTRQEFLSIVNGNSGP
jgi:GTP cyclohydrolase I